MIIMIVIAVPIPAVMVVAAAVSIAVIIRIVNSAALVNNTTRAGEKRDQAKQIHHQFHDTISPAFTT